MIVNTLKAVESIDYSYETYLCNEADDAYLESFCAEIGVHHVTRTKKKNANTFLFGKQAKTLYFNLFARDIANENSRLKIQILKTKMVMAGF